MSGHTPGPWFVEGDNCVAARVGEGFAAVAMTNPFTDLPHGGEEECANARAISAVPDLLEALEFFARLEIPAKPQGNAGFYSITFDRIERARDAIAKTMRAA